MDFRPLPDAHDDAWRRLLSYAFGPESGPELDDDDRPDRPEEYHRRGLYDVPADAPDDELDESDLVTVCARYDFTARVRGGFHPVAGLSAVASPPESRRQGHVAAMLDAYHEECREDGFGIAALWPFEYGFYRRFGYEKACDYAEITVAPEDLGDVADDPVGRFRRLDADDWAAVDAVHDQWATESFGLKRTESWWRTRAFQGWEKDPYVYGWTDDDGDLRGYLFYKIEEDGDDKRLDAWELAFADETARGQLYRFLRDHDSQVESVRLFGQVDTSLLDRLSDPRAVDMEVKPGPMIRLLDVGEALSAFEYDATGGVTVAVEDDHLACNDGVFDLTVADDGVTYLESDAEPDVRCDVATFSQLAFGVHDAATLERYGRLDVERDAARDTLDALFPSTDVFLREGF